MRYILVFLLFISVGMCQEPEPLSNTTTSTIPNKTRWPASERGVSYGLQSLNFQRNDTATLTFRRGTGEGTNFVPTGPTVTMTINLRNTCSGQSCVTFTLAGTTKRYTSRSDQRRLRQATRAIFAQWSEVLPEFFQPDRMVAP